MNFLVDRCAGRRLAEWLRESGHDVLDSQSLGQDPGDAELLQLAHRENRVLVTIDTDFGALLFVENAPHHGLIRLPDVPSAQRIALMARVLEDHRDDVASGAVITIKGDRIRISQQAS